MNTEEIKNNSSEDILEEENEIAGQEISGAEDAAADGEEAENVRNSSGEDEAADGEEAEKPEKGGFKFFKKDKEKDSKKDEEIAILKDQLMRSMAEYDNYRKRTAKEKLELEPEITAKIAAEFLPIADSIERALQHECTDENYKKGVELIYENFVNTFTKIGVEAIDTEGADFNPAYHQAVQQVQSDEVESGKIVSTFQKGYRIGDKILRFAMVSVAE